MHLHHGPIDLIIRAEGSSDAVTKAYRNARETFHGVLTELVSELPRLRQVLTEQSFEPRGAVAQRMVRAASAHAGEHWLTPMVAVAGSVADHILHAMRHDTALARIHVNNGGDIALWLAPDQRFEVGICEDITTPAYRTTLTLQAYHRVGGIATSGWRGRSHSLGIADAVTVLAADAASADAAATLIANAVDLPDCPRIHRLPAHELSPDSDLGDRAVTVGVEALSMAEVQQALQGGRSVAERCIRAGHIASAYIGLRGSTIVCGDVDAPERQRGYACQR